MTSRSEPHKNDPGVYQITYYDELGRKADQTLLTSYLDAVNKATEWKHNVPDGSAVIHRCVYNTKLVRPAYAPDMQY